MSRYCEPCHGVDSCSCPADSAPFPNFEMSDGQVVSMLEVLRRQTEREHQENASRYLADVSDELAQRRYQDSGYRIMALDKAIARMVAT